VTGDSAPQDNELRSLAAIRWKVAISLTVVMIATYFGFILLIAYDKAFLARLVRPGLSLGIVLGALVIVCSWLLTWLYVRWANGSYDERLNRLRR
jgi:uncharacterized membrane protein (DUF485 family)